MNHIKIIKTALNSAPHVAKAALEAACDLPKEDLAQINTDNLLKFFRCLPIGVMVTDASGRITAWNGAMERTFGWKEDEVIGMESPTIQSSDYPHALDIYKEMMAGKSIEGLDLKRSHRDGSDVYVCIWGFPYKDSLGQVSQLVFFVADMTAKKKTELELLEAKNQSDEINRVKSLFFANLSHEIRTPLASILGFSELLLKHEHKEQEADDFLARILKNGVHLQRLLDDVIDITKIEANELELNIQECEVRSFLDEIARSIELTLKEKDLSLKIEVDDRVPNSIITDPVRLKQIILNLLQNAVRHSFPSGRIDILTRMNDESAQLIEFRVKDRGSGVDPRLLNRLFDVFQGVRQQTGAMAKGKGLGLALSQRLAKLLGGELRLVHTEKNVGSTFAFTVKDQRVRDNVNLNDAGEESVRRPADHSLAGTKVIVVDDSEDIRLLVCTLLKGAGIKVTDFDSGYACLNDKQALLATDLILMDLEMPGINGLDTVATLRRQGFAKPILAVSAHAFREQQEKALAAGCNGYLTKPIILRHLLRAVHEQVHQRPA